MNRDRQTGENLWSFYYLLVAHKEPDKSVINKECGCIYTVFQKLIFGQICMQIWEYLHKKNHEKNKVQVKFPKCMKRKFIHVLEMDEFCP